MPVSIDYEHCTGCKICYNMCPMDIFEWDDERNVPIWAHPDECYHCGVCEIDCLELCIDVQLPLHARVAPSEEMPDLLTSLLAKILDSKATDDVTKCQYCGQEIVGKGVKKTLRGVPLRFCTWSCFILYRFDVPRVDHRSIYKVSIPRKWEGTQKQDL